MAQRVLLINPPVTRKAYLETNVSVGTPRLPSLGLAAIGGAVRAAGHKAIVLDLDLADVENDLRVSERLDIAMVSFKPDITAITTITPTWHTAMELAKKVKEKRHHTKIIMGGVHASLFPRETLKQETVDYVALGEGDFTINELLETGDPTKVKGLAFRKNGKLVATKPRTPLEDLDSLPMPDWSLFDINRYRMSHLTERRRPGGFIETSRGCPFNCIYCNKTTFGRKFRAKSPERVLAELEYMVNERGFKEIHIVDDGFSTDMDRAKEICRLIINSGLRFPFNLFNGIRADRVDDELLGLLRRAGCYQVAFGVESGNDQVLDSVSKGLDKDTIRKAVALSKKHGLETFGFFMIGLPEDNRRTVKETIRFAMELEMTISKFDMAVPLPGTKMFTDLDAAGLIRTKDWSRYIFHRTDEPLFDHPNMSWKEIERLYKLAYRKVYLNPKYIANRFAYDLRTGNLMRDFRYFMNARWS